ncbi:N1R/p28-like protein [Choristoneura biennis entomopoxvirus]|uniref:N1R/p28-like protein n=1 Tax=Choristoneura biennis entomopoxvirus TaxID=10288 RepID=A0A916KPG1_CBEPV|nr:N1R/p28-like protein [Choristoneura biennis entomopoxvirus]CCU55624.1 N1R/p28-like protein [Choristoneura biennis entomopoxvirus]
MSRINHIKGSYYYIKYNNYKIIINIQNYYFNVSKLFESFNKDFDNWYAMKSSKEYITKKCKEHVDIKYIVTGKNSLGGIYFHPSILSYTLQSLHTDSNDNLVPQQFRKNIYNINLIIPNRKIIH